MLELGKMNDKQLEVYKALSTFKGTENLFVDEEDFREQISNNPNDVYEALSTFEGTDKLFIDEDDFFEQVGLKKNEKNQLQEEAITEDSSTVAEPLQESGGEGRQDRGLENPMALYGKYTANKFELDQALKKKAQFEDADFLTQAIISKDIDKNNERILEITANQTIYTDKLLQPLKEEFKNLAYGEDGKVKSDFVATNYYGINNPDLDKIKEYADEKITDENLRRVFIKNTQATLQASLDNFDEIYNKNLDIAFEEQIGRDNYITPVKSVKSVLEEKAKKAYAEKYVPLLQERITASNNSIDSLKAEVEPMVINQINALKAAAEKANEEYIAETQTILNTPAYTPEEVKLANVKLESLYKNHVQKVGDYITKSQEIENNYNSRLNRHAAKLEREYQEYASAINQKFNEEYKLDPETKKALDAASKIAAERTQNQININKKIVIQKGDAMGFNPMGFNLVRVITSFASSLAGMVNDKAVMAGAVDGVTLDKIEQFFQPNVSPIKGFEDLSIYSLQESTGSLMGSMMPSVISGLGTAVVTKNFNTTAKVITSGMSQFLTVSYDNMASTYREVYDETGSVEKAKDAAKEVWEGQLKIAPVYVLTGLKFTDALSKLGTPARVVAGGAIELVGETTEETFESSIQAQVSETGSQEGFTSQITPQSIEENFVNVLPTGVMGMFGAGGSPTNKIYKAPDLAIQHLYNVIERDGKGAANLEIATLYNRGKISEDVFKKLSNYIDNHEFANSKSYNAIMAKKDMVAESIELEKDPVKKKILKEQVKAYEELMERTLLGEEGLTSEVEVDGEKYIDITNNPIKLIRLLNEKEKIGSKEGKTPAEKQVEDQATTEAKKTEKTTVEQKDDIYRIRQEELNSPLQSTSSQKVGSKGKTVASQYEDEFVSVVAYEDADGTPSIVISINQGDKDSTKEVVEQKTFETLDEAKEYGNNYIKQRSKIYDNHIEKTNSKYDAKYVDAVKKGEMTKEQAMQALEEVGRKDSDAYSELKALEQQSTTGKKEVILNDKEVDISDEQFDKALEIIEPTASERGELTIEQVEDVFNALGDGAGDVIDISKKQDAVSLYNDLTDKKKEYNAKRNESESMREQGGKKEAEGTVDSDMSEVNETKLQDGEKEKIAQEIGKSRKVRAKNIRGLLDVMAGIFGLNKNQAESAAVVGDVIIGNAAKRAGVSKDEMYQIIAFQKAQKAPDGSLKQDAPLTFKSTAKEGIGKIQQTSATPEQWVKQISEKGGKGTSQELEWIGLQDYLNEWKKENNAKSVPKEVVEQYINDNQIEIVEVSKGGQDIRNQREFLEKQQQEALDNEDYEGAEFYERELIKLNEKATEANNEAKYSDLTLEGGENYREVLLTLPNNKKSDQKYYKKEHFDEANILAHLRLNERTLPNGERVLFIEEVQSDWAQEGKKKGFGDRGKITESDIEIISDEKRYYDSELEGYEHRVEFRVKGFDGTDRVSYNDGNPNEKNITDLKKRLVFDYNKELLGEDRTPDMPYKKTDQWVGMALRRVMQMASQEGFDRIAWVTGEQSAERYDLSKQVDRVEVADMLDGNRSVYISMKDNSDIQLFVDPKTGKILQSTDKGIDGKMLEDVVGKEISNKILNLNTEKESVISSEGLKVGGEGMKTFYNSILPKVASKEAKRFD